MSLKKRMCSMLLVLALLSVLSAMAFAEKSSDRVELSLEVTNLSGHDTVQPGDKLKLTVYVQGEGQGFLGGKFIIDYDETVIDEAVAEYAEVEFPDWLYKDYDRNGRYLKLEGNTSTEYNQVIALLSPDASGTLLPDGNPGRREDYDPIKLPTVKTELFSVELTVTGELPAGEKDVLFVLKAETVKIGHCIPVNEESTCTNGDLGRNVINNETTVSTAALKLDGVGPTFGSIEDGKTYYYQPVEFTVTDNSGIANVTLDGAALTAANGTYSLTKGGKLVATDTIGNRTELTVTVDSKAFDDAKAAAAKVPAPDTLQYSEAKALLAAAEVAMEKVTDATAQSKLTAEQARIDAAKAKIAELDKAMEEVAADIEKLPAADAVKPADMAAVNAVKEKVETLLKAGFKTSDITNYEKYAAVSEKAKAMQGEIDGVKAQIAALPAKDAVTFEDEAKVAKAEKDAAALKDKYGDEILTEAENNAVTAARAGLTELAAAKEALISDIADAELAVSLRQADVDAITALRARVTAMTAQKKASFTANELKNLTDAEKELTALQAKSKALHDKIAALPAKDDVKYTQKDALAQLREGIKELEAQGDTFTKDETAKITEAESGIAAIEASYEALAAKLDALDGEKKNAEYSDMKEVAALNAAIAALKKAEYPIDMTTDGFKKYSALCEMVDVMQADIAARNKAMADALQSWKYDPAPDSAQTKKFDAIRAEMNALQKKYKISDAEKAAAFPRFNESNVRNEAVTKEFNAIKAEINKLPANITLNDQAQVNVIAAKMNALKEAYGLTDAELAKWLGSAYKTYTDAKAEVEKQLAAANVAPPAAPVKTSPQTSNGSFPYLCLSVAVFACMGIAMSVKKREEE